MPSVNTKRFVCFAFFNQKTVLLSAHAPQFLVYYHLRTSVMDLKNSDTHAAS